MKLALDIAILLLVAALGAVTLLPLSGSHAWWVRMWDIPRLHVAVALLAAIALCFLLPAPLRWAAIALAASCLAYQGWRIFPYTPLARAEIRIAGSESGAAVTMLAANVEMGNDDHAAVLRLIGSVDPDILLLMETDRIWVDALEPALRHYPTVLREPREDFYGMVFATRLEADRAEIVRLTRAETPATFAVLRDADGRPFHFIGLHPEPPVPGADTDERDAQILYAARFARIKDMPLIAMGDFNDAAWSDTAQTFKHYGRYRDPRVGRGLFASFHAEHPMIRAPIDQLYVTEDVAIAGFRLGPRIGSDHLPVIAEILIDRQLAARLNSPAPSITDTERAELDRRVEEYRRTLAAIPR